MWKSFYGNGDSSILSAYPRGVTKTIVACELLIWNSLLYVSDGFIHSTLNLLLSQPIHPEEKQIKAKAWIFSDPAKEGIPD